MSAIRVFCGNYNGTVERMVAAKTATEAARLIGTSLHRFRGYYSVTGNADDISVAMASPGTVFQRSYRDKPIGKRAWKPISPEPTP